MISAESSSMPSPGHWPTKLHTGNEWFGKRRQQLGCRRRWAKLGFQSGASLRHAQIPGSPCSYLVSNDHKKSETADMWAISCDSVRSWWVSLFVGQKGKREQFTSNQYRLLYAYFSWLWTLFQAQSLMSLGSWNRRSDNHQLLTVRASTDVATSLRSSIFRQLLPLFI